MTTSTLADAVDALRADSAPPTAAALRAGELGERGRRVRDFGTWRGVAPAELAG